MVAGLPGAGLGGLFYLASALLMPFRALRKSWRDEREGRMAEVRQQVLIAATILGAIWLTGWILGLILTKTGALPVSVASGPLRHLPGASSNVVRVAMFLGGFATLAVVVLFVDVARFMFSPRREGARDGDLAAR